ncbi:MAG: chemotaxis protein CheW [Lachnospiraceae bacterium]|nr:chemotaxis protein CheW [Lachnospiraceae bacterium]MBQ8167240.1 chemotaxis protein CheW [Lachnospiraceae bacterium]
MADIKYMVFGLEDQLYSLKLSNINGIEYIYNIVPVPAGAKYMKGIIHLRNNIVPVFNLKEKFGIEETNTSTEKQLLITESHDMKLAIEVDCVKGIIPVPEESVKVVPEVIKGDDTGYLENVIKVVLPETNKEELVITISIDRLMPDADFENIASSIQGIE